MVLVKEILGKDRRRLTRCLKGPTSGLPRSRSARSIPFLIAIAAVVAAALAAACDDGEDGTPGTITPTVVVPTAAPSPEQQLLDQAVLRVEDLPVGLTRVDASTSTNEDLAADEANPEEELARLESLGRLLGYEVTFVPGPEADPELTSVAVTSAASLYRDPEGASASFADTAQEARAADWLAAYTDLTDVQVREVERPALADEVVWIRITGFQDEEQSTIFIEDFVVLRRSRVRGYLRAVSLTEASTSRDLFLQDVEGLAALQVQRIDAALEES